MSAELSERLLTGPSAYFNLLLAVCDQITASQGVSDHHIAALHQLMGKSLLKAVELIDKEVIEYVTSPPGRNFFVIRRPSSNYFLYESVPYCTCPYFRFNVLKHRKRDLCKHIIACHMALSVGKCSIRKSAVYMNDEEETT